jgi:isovaleryl-CoA dehydrogenase
MTQAVRLGELRDRVRAVAGGPVAEDSVREDLAGSWPERSLRALAEAGLGGLHAPREVGGSGLGLEALVIACEELGRESPSAAICFGMHCVGTAVIAAKATEEQRERYLRPIVAGEHITTLSLSEPGTGSHFWIPETEVRVEDDALVLHGRKSFVTSGGHADSYVLSVTAVEDSGDEGRFSCVVLDRDADGISWEEHWQGFGMRGNSSRGVTLEGVRLPPGNLLGEQGDQLWYTFEVVAPYFLTAMAGTYLGIAVEAVEIAREHVGSRRHSHSGELLGAEPIVSHRLGEMWVEMERTRQLIYASARRADAGEPDALAGVLACKAAAADSSVQLVNEAMTLAGGRGYAENGKLGRLLRDARASHVMAPTTDHLKGWIGRAMLNLPLV